MDKIAPRFPSLDRRAGDLLISTFSHKRSILIAGTHAGMAPTSVLEPVVLLYRATGRPGFLQAAEYAWEDANAKRLYITGGTSAGDVKARYGAKGDGMDVIHGAGTEPGDRGKELLL